MDKVAPETNFYSHGCRCPKCQGLLSNFIGRDDAVYCSSCSSFWPKRSFYVDREQFSTGAVRSHSVAGAEGARFQPRFDLLIANDSLIKRLAAIFGEGAAKYGDDNWRQGMPEKSLVNHALGHLVQYYSGDRTEDHLAKVVWNIGAVMWMQDHKPEMMDLSKLVEAVSPALGHPDIISYLSSLGPKVKDDKVSDLKEKLANLSARNTELLRALGMDLSDDFEEHLKRARLLYSLANPTEPASK